MSADELRAEIPGKTQIEEQLRHMLASRMLTSAPKQAEILRLIVESALEGKTLSEKELGPLLYGENYDPEANHVRVNAGFLRERLDKYYSTAGKDDLVEIRISLGQGYRPTFSFNHRATSRGHLRRAIHYSRQLDLNLGFWAGHEFYLARKRHGPAAEIHSAESESELLRFLLGRILECNEQRSIFDNSSIEYHANKAIDAGLVGDCLPHLILGATSTLRVNVKDARSAFEKAIAIDPVASRLSIWYAFFLLASGQQDDAVGIAKANLERVPESVNASLALALALYLRRDYKQAGEAVCENIAIGKSQILQSLLSGLISLAERNYEAALKLFEEASVVEKAEWDVLNIMYGYARPPLRFGGLVVLCLGRLGRLAEARERFEEMKGEPELKPLQKAFGYMGIGKGQRAITCLRQACLRGEIILPVLGMWPFLDDLRDNPRIARLVKDIADIWTSSE